MIINYKQDTQFIIYININSPNKWVKSSQQISTYRKYNYKVGVIYFTNMKIMKFKFDQYWKALWFVAGLRKVWTLFLRVLVCVHRNTNNAIQPIPDVCSRNITCWLANTRYNQLFKPITILDHYILLTIIIIC